MMPMAKAYSGKHAEALHYHCRVLFCVPADPALKALVK